MIQIVSAYLIKQRGRVTDDDPSHVLPKYIPKNMFKQWLMNDPLNYDKHIFVGFSSNSIVHQITAHHNATMFLPEYDQTDTYAISPKTENQYTTLDGNRSVKQLAARTWGLLNNSEFSQSYIGGYSCTSDGAINNISYYEVSSQTSFVFSETKSMIRTNGVQPDPSVTDDIGYGTFAAETQRRSWIYDDWFATFYSARIVNGVPVFTTYEAGMNYCDKLVRYLEDQSSSNYQDVCNAIDAAINGN